MHAAGASTVAMTTPSAAIYGREVEGESRVDRRICPDLPGSLLPVDVLSVRAGDRGGGGLTLQGEIREPGGGLTTLE